MATIIENELFVWSDFDFSLDLLKISSILENIPDEGFMRILEKERGPSGVNDYPIRAVWNSLLVFSMTGHNSVESLRRELLRTHQPELRAIFQKLQNQLITLLPDFGENLAIDGKALPSFGKKTACKKGDRREDHNADWSKHVTRWSSSDGKTGEKNKSWFGYTLHLIADTKYELPVAFHVLPASVSERPVARKMIDQIKDGNPELLKRCQYFTADRGYDDKATISKL